MKITSKKVLTDEVREFFREQGAIGGSSKSAAKMAALAINQRMPCRNGKKRGRPLGSKNKKK